jgi:hypothetical protein
MGVTIKVIMAVNIVLTEQELVVTTPVVDMMRVETPVVGMGIQGVIVMG